MLTVLTLLGDVLKGTAAVAIGRFLEVGPFYEGLIGLCAILGHNFSIFLGFRGGKGVATSLGVLFVYTPGASLFTLVIWIIIVILTKYSSLGAIISFGLLPVNVALFDPHYGEKLFITVLITILILVRHKDNIGRLIRGTERKIGQRE